MPSNVTPNYALSQWERTDKILMDDFNGDNAKIDGVLAAQAALLAGLEVRKGNCTIEAFSYVGQGNAGSTNPTRITFPRPPLFFIVFGDYSIGVGTKLRGGVTVTARDNVFIDRGQWNGNTISFSNTEARWQLSASGETYWVFAFYTADE